MVSECRPETLPACRHCAGRLGELRSALTDLLNDDGQPSGVTVFVLTFCRNPEFFYGSSLIFRTLRTGFPTARIIVVDNASAPTLRDEIVALAKANGCGYFQIAEPAIEHPEFLEIALLAFATSRSGDRTIVFLDPDVCLWENCQDLRFDSLMAGRFCPAFECEGTKTLFMPRLHTSYLWIPSGRGLWEAIEACRAQHYDFRPFDTWSTKIAGRWYRYDTGASLYAVLGHRMSAFQENHLRCYDHIFAGCHLDWIEGILDAQTLQMLRSIHARAREGDLAALRGVHQWQDAVWRNLRS